jgi:hypothetical protein
MDFVEVGWGDVDWIGLAQDRDRWRALVNSVLNLRFYKMLGHYRVYKQLGISRVVLSSMELVIWGKYPVNVELIIKFEVLTAVVMNVAIFTDVAPCSPYMD